MADQHLSRGPGSVAPGEKRRRFRLQLALDLAVRTRTPADRPTGRPSQDRRQPRPEVEERTTVAARQGLDPCASVDVDDARDL